MLTGNALKIIAAISKYEFVILFDCFFPICRHRAKQSRFKCSFSFLVFLSGK